MVNDLSRVVYIHNTTVQRITAMMFSLIIHSIYKSIHKVNIGTRLHVQYDVRVHLQVRVRLLLYCTDRQCRHQWIEQTLLTFVNMYGTEYFQQ